MQSASFAQTKETMASGIILGSFMPPHEGHRALIRTGSYLVDDLTLVLNCSDNDPIAPELRVNWLQEMFPAASVLIHNNGAETLPKDHPNWGSILQDLHPAPIDRVIGSEGYVKDLASQVSAQHFILDPMWMAFPANSADIRDNPFENWEYMPGPVRSHYQKRLTLVGGESTGKSYMVDFLAAHFGGPYVPEYGRPYERFRDLGDYRAEELHFIVDGHVAHRKALSQAAGPVLFEDTDPLLTAVWAEMLLGHSLPDLEARIELPDHYLLLDSNVPWEADPVRYYGSADMRKRFYNKIVAQLEKHGASYTIIKGSFAEREAQAVSITQALLAKDVSNV